MTSTQTLPKIEERNAEFGFHFERSKTKIALNTLQIALTVTSIVLCELERRALTPNNDQSYSLRTLQAFNVAKLPLELTYFLCFHNDIIHRTQGIIPGIFATLGAWNTPKMGSFSSITLGFTLVSNFISIQRSCYQFFSFKSKNP